MPKTPLTPAPLKSVSLSPGFWGQVQKDMHDKVIPYQWEALNDRVPGAAPSYCIHNFEVAAGRKEGVFGGCVFQDSDLAKWIEAAAYALATHPDPDLEKTVDEAIELVEAAQQPDGYLDTYFIIKEPDQRFANLRDQHELYCAGHMMEAAVAYYEATGKRRLLDVMLRNAALIGSVLGPNPGQKPGYPGHEEIELALVRMYRATGEAGLLALASYFIDQRGQDPKYFIEGERHENASVQRLSYHQSHLPVREQETVEGHSVRALYLLSGMIDVAAETGDPSLMEASRRLFDNATQKRMYITGGVGSTHHGEAFSFDYDLPNDTVYAETCASIALVFAAWRLLQADPQGRYADVMERALYNTCLAGMSLDGQRFFYVNPLSVNPEASEKDPGKHHALAQRPQWFGCACCPPNLARLVASLGQYLYSTDANGVYVHLYAASQAELTLPGGQIVRLSQRTAYPKDGQIDFTLSAGKYALRLRLPEWCKEYWLTVEGREVKPDLQNGYLVLDRDWEEGDSVSLNLSMPPRRVWVNPLVAEDVGRVALQRGPLVYCLEQADNGPQLHRVLLPREAPLETFWRGDLLGGVTVITAQGLTSGDREAALYRDQPPAYDQPIDLTFIPYYAWANRGLGEMTVYVRERTCGQT